MLASAVMCHIIHTYIFLSAAGAQVLAAAGGQQAAAEASTAQRVEAGMAVLRNNLPGLSLGSLRDLLERAQGNVLQALSGLAQQELATPAPRQQVRALAALSGPPNSLLLLLLLLSAPPFLCGTQGCEQGKQLVFHHPRWQQVGVIAAPAGPL